MIGLDPTASLANAFLRERLDPFEVSAGGKPALRNFVEDHSRGTIKEKQLDAMWNACERARAMYGALRAKQVVAVLTTPSFSWLVNQSLDHISFLEAQVAKLEARIKDLYLVLDPTRLLEQEVPGFGATIAVTVEAFAGDVERFGSVKRYAARSSGLVPSTKQTGMSGRETTAGANQGWPESAQKYMFLAAETARRH